MSNSAPVNTLCMNTTLPEPLIETTLWNSVVTHILKGKKRVAGFSEGKHTSSERQKIRQHKNELPQQLLLAQENERKRLARDLHDGLGQTLSLLKFGIGDTQRLLAEKSLEETADLLVLLDKKISDAITELRQITMDLCPPSIEDLGLLPTISWLLREFQQIHQGIDVEKMMGIKEADIPLPLKISIYRILQEALHNVAKHAQTSRLCVQLHGCHNGITLIIKDFGCGFDIQQNQRDSSKASRNGLISMQDRARISGGKYQITSRPGQGTEIRIIWPGHSLQTPRTPSLSPFTRHMPG